MYATMPKKETPYIQSVPSLILNWVVSYNSLPIVMGDYDRTNQRLTLPIDPMYDSRYISVLQDAPGSSEYTPTHPGPPIQYREFMTQNVVQVLPRYVVVLSLSTSKGSQVILMFIALKEKLEMTESVARRKLKDRLQEV